MELEALRGVIHKLEKKKDAEWLKNLPTRKIDEIEHHNTQRDQKLKQDLPHDTFEMLHGNKKFYATIEASDNYMREWLRTNVPGKVFLDYACGDGQQVIQAAKDGAGIAIGIDLSDVSIENARKAAARANVSARCIFIQGDCEKTELPDESIDVILCSGVLHHMDLSYAYPEMRRILKKGGRILALEALNYNPIIKLYRQLTPHMRTEWEKHHILSLKEVRQAKMYFQVKDIRYWHLFSVLAAYLRGRERIFTAALSVFNRLDDVLTRIPGLQLMAWQFTFELQKG